MKKHYHKVWVEPDFDKAKPIAFDTETYIPTSSKSKVASLALYGSTRLIQLAQDGVCHMYDCLYVDIRKVKEYLTDTHIYAHNIIYDLTCPDTNNIKLKQFDCTLYMCRYASPMSEFFSLHTMLTQYQIGAKTDEGKSDWSERQLSKEQLDYAANDVLYLEKLYYKIIDVTKNPLYKLDILNLKLALDYAKNGLPVHNSNRLKHINELKARSYNLPSSLNINSPKQVTQALGSSDSTSNTLNMMAVENNSIAIEVLKKRKDTKQLSFLEDKFCFDRVYGIFNPYGAKSGRWTCKGNGHSKSSQNLQQLPRDLKDCFGFEDTDNRWLVDCDYTALEIHTLACIMGEQKMADIIRTGGDLHYATAEMIYNKPRDEISKKERQIAKGLNFSLAYGGGAEMARLFLLNMTNILLSVDEISVLRTKWLRAYPSISAYHAVIGKHDFRKRPMEVVSPFGRRMRANSYTEAINMPCQSAGSDCTKLAIKYLYERIPNVKLVTTVHDSITLEVSSQEEGHRQGKILKACMDESWLTLCKHSDPKIMKITDLVMDNKYDVIKTLGDA